MKHFLTLSFSMILFLISYLLVSSSLEPEIETGNRIVDFLFGLAAMVVGGIFICKVINEPFSTTT